MWVTAFIQEQDRTLTINVSDEKGRSQARALQGGGRGLMIFKQKYSPPPTKKT